ncbi:hypothetical protein [Lentzea sp. CA-135723]|uniref:hypothetical protein n=1 Tax=Lentzea sp. CA-135723 TaxID=3239950 RepID=UPI003D8B6309
MARKGRGKGKTRPPKQQKPQPAEEASQGRSKGAAIVGAATLLLAVASLVFAILSYTNDRVVATNDTTPNVDFVIVKPDVKENIPVQIPNEETRKEGDLVDGGVLAGGSAAVDIVLNNSGGQTAVIHKIDVTIKDYARLGSCTGAGGLPATASFDFRIPTEGGISGYTASKEDLFTIEGQKPDRMRVAIGPDKLDEGTWGWIYVVSVTVHVKSLKGGAPDQTLETPDVIVVDNRVIARYERSSLDNGSPDWKACVRGHRVMVNKMVNRPEQRSKVLDDLNDAIKKVVP